MSGEQLTLGEDAAQHMRVRRVDVGERVGLRDGAGHVAAGVLVRLAKGHAVVKLDEVSDVEPPPPVHMLVPVADRERMLLLAEKCAELGTASWRPVVWRRSKSVSPRGEGTTFQSKLRARMAAALIQSGGAWLPALYPESTVERAAAASPAGTRLLLDPTGPPILGRSIVPPVVIATGPEGGVEGDERAQLVAAGFEPVALGGNVLRFETAAISALAVVRAALSLSTVKADD